MPTQGVRERSLDRKIEYPPFTKNNGLLSPRSSTTWKGRQYTVSSGHRRGPDGRYHEGGPFFTFRDQASVSTRQVTLKAEKPSPAKYQGPISTAGVSSNFGTVTVPDSDSSFLDPYGAEAISIIDPTDPNAETGVALGEILKDRYIPIPGIKLWERRVGLAKKAGDQYLNAVFGWLPLVRDMKNTAQSVLQGNTILDNYRAASGTLVHREFSFDDEVSSKSEETTIGHAVFSASTTEPKLTTSGSVPATRTEKTTIKRWFSGSFTYHAHQGSSLKRMLGIGTEAEKLFGLSLSPDLVWELTPWSWAIDWFSNAGNVISNVNAFALAGLVMQYGYIMEESSTIVTYTPHETGLIGLTGTTPPVVRTFCSKRRREANPFGFGVKWEGLSPTQLAITAALGLTHLR